MLSDAIEQKLEDVIDRVPGGSEAVRSSNRPCRSRSRQRSIHSFRSGRTSLCVRAEIAYLSTPRAPLLAAQHRAPRSAAGRASPIISLN
jgi:hypothetical protein